MWNILVAPQAKSRTYETHTSTPFEYKYYFTDAPAVQETVGSK